MYRQVVLSALLIVSFSASASAQARIWIQHGPGPSKQGQVENITDREISGAINAIAPHPTDPNTLYVGAVNGGIWKTTNAAAAAPKWIDQLGTGKSLSIGAIEFDPTDATNQTLVAGTGRFSSLSRFGGDRAGLWRTSDGGATWTAIGGTLVGLNINGVAARGATIVVAANDANSFANRGIWRSTDTGGSWTKISGLAGSGLSTGAAFDLARDPSNNARLFTNAGTNGLFRSDDTGANWTKVSNAAMDALILQASRVEISVGASNNVYVATDASSPNDTLSGLFRSGDGGGSWTALDLPTTTESGVPVGVHPGKQGNNNLSLLADPTNANVVYIAGDRQPDGKEFSTAMPPPPQFPNSIGANDYSGRLFRVDASLPTGSQATHITHTNTTSSSSPHADSRDMAMDATGNLLESDDGGVYRRTTPLLNTGDWFSVNGDLIVSEMHDGAWDSNSKVTIGGAQDNGNPLQQTPANIKWQSVSTGDGGDVGVDDRGTPGISIRYTSADTFRSPRRRTYNAANTLTAVATPALVVVAPGANLVGQFVTPIAINAITPTRLIIGGGNSVYESTDQGATITEIAPGVIANGFGTDAIAYGGSGNADMLYIGVGDQVRIRNAAPPAALTASATYPGAGTGRNVSGIVLDPSSAQIAFVINNSNVFRTPDGGATWTNVTGDLMTLNPDTLLSIAFSNANGVGTVIVGSKTGVFIANGPGFNTWSVLGTGLPRVPVYDLEFDPVDSVLAAATLGRGLWTVNMGERTPTDVALVLDYSGSMLDPACAGCASKLDVLKDAVELFVQLWTTLTVPSDRLGVEYFRTNITEFAIGPDVLVPVVANAAAIIADVRNQTTTPASRTAMGGGIQTAVNRLTDATRPRHMIVFTDGMQNVNPMVNATTMVIDNEAGRPASGVNPTAPATDLNAALGIKAHTIGVGATPAFVTLLSDIASETGGLFKLTTAPDAELRRFYIEELVEVLRDFSPQLIAYRYNTVRTNTATESFTVNASARKVILKLSWQRPQKMSFTVEKGGVDVTARGRTISGSFYQIFVIDVPTTSGGPLITSDGDWVMRITGSRAGAYQAAAIVDEEKFKYDMTFGRGRRIAGDPIPLRVRIKFADKPVTDARVTGRLLRPTQSARGVGIAEPITFTNNNNGTYSANITNTRVAGGYTVQFQIDGKRADIGSYRRTETQSTAIRFGHPVRAASGLGASLIGTPGSIRRYLLRLKPVDQFGNYLGPDYGGAIKVLVDGKAVSDAPHEQRDGSYAVTLSVPAGSDPSLKIMVFDEPLFEAPFSRFLRAEGIAGRSRTR